MQPDIAQIAIRNNRAQIRNMLMELVLRPRRDLTKWANTTKQTPNIKIGYPGQHLASLVAGMEGTRTGARGHDLCDMSEVKSCSRVDQLDKCKVCKAAVARIEPTCPQCGSDRIKRNNDSKWLLGIKSREELAYLLDEVPRVIFILSDYPYYDRQDWDTLQFQVFEIWPSHDRHRNFRELMTRYFENIYLPHIEQNPQKTPAPKNFWPYSFQFYMCNPVRTLQCMATNANTDPHLEILEYVEPDANRAEVSPVRMPYSVLNHVELTTIRQHPLTVNEEYGLNEGQRSNLRLRDSDHAIAHDRTYRRGAR